MKLFAFYILFIIFIQKTYSFDFLSTEEIEENKIQKLFEWNTTQFMDNNERINCTSCIPDKIKSLDGEKFFCNFPRNDNNSFFTFALFNASKNYFEPWPNISTNQLNLSDDSGLISVTAFEFDEENNIYILDNGRINYSEASNNSMKLLKYAQNRTLLDNISFYDINSSIINKPETYFTDMVLDKEHNYMILSDSSISSKNGELYSENPGIFIFNLDFKNPKLYKILNDSEYFKPDKTYWYHYNDKPIYSNTSINIGITGLTISCDMKYLFFTSLSSRKFYSISTQEIYEHIENGAKINVHYSYKNEASFGLVLSSKGNLYMSGIESGSIYSANQIDYDLQRFDYRDLYQIKINKTNMLAKYMDINDGKIYFIINKIKNIFNNFTYEDNENFSNFEIDYFEVEGEKSYRFGCDGVEFSLKPGNIIIWIIFLFVLFIVFVFVCASKPSREVKYTALN